MDVIPYLAAALSHRRAGARRYYYIDSSRRHRPGDERMVFLMTEIQKGAKAFLQKEYTVGRRRSSSRWRSCWRS